MISHRSAAICACLICLFVSIGVNGKAEQVDPTGPPPALAQTLTASIELSDWGIEDPRDIVYVSVGILRSPGADRLVIYDVRDRTPVAQQPSSGRRTLSMTDGYFLIAHFDRGIRNRLSGYSGPFVRSPSSGELAIDDTPNGERALAFRYQRSESGFTGFWVHLFDFKSTERILLDAGNIAFLTFRIRGLIGDERVVLRAADDAWERRGDSLAIGDVGSFVKTGEITTQWQQAWVPLNRLPERIDRSSLASLVFAVEEPGRGTVFIKDMALAESRDAMIPQSKTEPIEDRSWRKAMWVWETEKIAASDRETTDLAEFCRVQGITDIYLQIPDAGPARLRHVVAKLHAVGVRVDALDGDPRLALERHHAEVLAAIGRIVAYNESAPSSERYDGIRYDNEPYLLPGFAGVRKPSVLREYLRLLEKGHALSKAAGLSFGVDIPFWFDARDRFLEPVAAVDGRALSELVIDRVDNVAIMDYRTSSYGPDGVIAHAGDELRYATERGKSVFVGLETVALPDEVILDFGTDGRDSRVLIGALDEGRVELRWVAAQAWSGVVDTEAARNATRVLAQTFAAEAPASKVTFAGWPATRLERVMQQTSRELAATPSFIGFAVHSYESYKPWLASSR